MRKFSVGKFRGRKFSVAENSEGRKFRVLKIQRVENSVCGKFSVQKIESQKIQCMENSEPLKPENSVP